MSHGFLGKITFTNFHKISVRIISFIISFITDISFITFDLLGVKHSDV